jgi:hypothetical protein
MNFSNMAAAAVTTSSSFAVQIASSGTMRSQCLTAEGRCSQASGPAFVRRKHTARRSTA